MESFETPQQGSAKRPIVFLVVVVTMSMLTIGHFGWTGIKSAVFESTQTAPVSNNGAGSSVNSDAQNETESLSQKHKSIFVSPDQEIHESCGWSTSQTAKWTSNTEDENSFFWNVMACHKRLFPSRAEQWDENYEKYRPIPASLRCGDNIMDEFQSILSHYDKIAFFGDSIQRQLFFTLSCMTNTSLSKSDVVPPTNEKGLYYWNHEPTNTFIMFSESPRASHEHGTFQNITTVDSSPRHAAIVNLGAHYRPHAIKFLIHHTRSIADVAETTSTNIFWVETVDFQWPTTNGEFIFYCREECKCEALTPDRILGTGEFTGPDRYRNMTDYPLYNISIPPNFSGVCIPYCLPANWRNDVTNSVLDDPKYTAIHLVPIWQQLVSSGYPQSRFVRGDCTHKSTDALLAMAQQLLRALRKPTLS